MAGNGTRTLKVVIVGNAASAKKALAATSEGAVLAESKIGKLGSKLTMFAKVGAVALGAVAVKAGDIGIKTASAMEQAKIGFTTMLGSAEKADTFYRSLQSFAAKTPFDLAGVTKSSQQLLAMGTHAKDVIPTLTAIGDGVAALGGGADTLERVTAAIGQIQAKGKVQSQEMMQLTENGIPAWKFLASYLHTTIPDAMKRVTAGGVDAAQGITALTTGMEQAYGGMMSKQSKTLAGQWSTLKDTVSLALGNLMLKILPLVERVLPKLISLVGSIGPAIHSAADAVTSFFGKLSSGSGKASGVVTSIQGAWGSLRDFLGDVFASITGYYDKHQAQIQALADKARVVLTQLGTMFSAAFAAIAAVVEVGFKVVSVLWDTFGATILGFLTDTVGNIETVFGGLFKALQGVFDVFAGIFSGDWARVWKGLGEIFGGVWDVIKGVLKQALAVIKAALSAALDAIGALWSKAWDGIKAVFVGIWHGIRAVLSGDWQAIRSLIVQPVSDGVDHIKGWFDKLVGFVASLPGKIGHAASGAFDGLWDAFRDSVNHIIDGWNSLSFTLPKVNTHIPGVGTIGGWTISTPDIPRLAVGGTIDTAGLALVGERGPELVSLPSGATVYPNSSPQTRGALGGGVTVHANVNFNVEGSVDERVLPIIDARIDGAFAQLVQEIEAGLEG